MSTDDGFASAITTIGQALLALIILSVILGAVFNAGIDILGETGTEAVTPQTGSFVRVGGDLTYSYGIDADATLENALSFDGTSVVETGTPANVSVGSWSVCSTVQLGSDTNLNATYDIVAYDNESIVLQYDAGEWSVYHNNSTHDARATINAPTPRGTTGLLSSDPFTSVCGRYDHTANELVVSRDDTISSPVALTTATTTRNTSWQWVGRQDEVRVFNTSISNATITEYANDPIRPQPGSMRVARFMFDEGTGSSTTVYFADVTVGIGNASWASGVSKPGISVGSDYEFARSPLRIKAVSGGYLDGAPVVYVISGADVWYTLLNTFASYGTTAFVLIGLGLLALGASWLNGEVFSQGRGGR